MEIFPTALNSQGRGERAFCELAGLTTYGSSPRAWRTAPIAPPLPRWGSNPGFWPRLGAIRQKRRRQFRVRRASQQPARQYYDDQAFHAHLQLLRAKMPPFCLSQPEWRAAESGANERGTVHRIPQRAIRATWLGVFRVNYRCSCNFW